VDAGDALSCALAAEAGLGADGNGWLWRNRRGGPARSELNLKADSFQSASQPARRPLGMQTIEVATAGFPVGHPLANHQISNGQDPRAAFFIPRRAAIR
jgi:hypothetical protein